MITKATVAIEEQQNQPGKLAELQAKVDALQEELRQAQRLATVGTMTAMVVHEFNNILTPIINYAHMAEKDPEMVTKAITRASVGGQRASDICEALLGIVDGLQNRPPAQQNIVEMTRDIISAMGRNPGKDGIDLAVDIPEDMTIVTRRCEFQQVLLNLLLNARAAVLEKSMPRSIRITAERENNSIVVRVADNGVGIGPEIIDKIFQPFFTTKSEGGNGEHRGHGLGLAFCRKIMDMLSGQISVETELGVGTIFTLRFPA